MNNIVCFHNPDEENGYLSNWYHCKFYVNDIEFTSGEQYMMYSKAILFRDYTTANEILKITDFAKIKALGRKVHNFDDNIWDALKFNIMYTGLYNKFIQNQELAAMLKSTGNSILAECAVRDRIWAIGLSMNDSRRFDTSQWQGQNLLGQVLMKVRDTL